jgi:hypothetical protein
VSNQKGEKMLAKYTHAAIPKKPKTAAGITGTTVSTKTHPMQLFRSN